MSTVSELTEATIAWIKQDPMYATYAETYPDSEHIFREVWGKFFAAATDPRPLISGHASRALPQ